jgi:DNA replication ATP-dependent helicase Dna2
MNVSFTRARAKLVIFGSRKTLQREPLLAQFFKLMEEQKWILHLPPGSDSAHVKMFEGVAPQPSLTGVQGEDMVAGHKRRHPGKENATRKGQDKEVPPSKKIKIATNTKAVTSGLLSGKPILQDLVANQV